MHLMFNMSSRTLKEASPAPQNCIRCVRASSLSNFSVKVHLSLLVSVRETADILSCWPGSERLLGIIFVMHEKAGITSHMSH